MATIRRVRFIIFLGAGLSLLLAAVLALRTRAFVARSEHVVGTVTEMIEGDKPEGSNKPVYSPLVSFTTLEGKADTFVPNNSSTDSPFKVGDQVPVLYDPANLRRVSIGTPGQIWSSSITFLGLSLATLVVGQLVFLLQKKRLIAAEAKSTGASAPPPPKPFA